MENIQDMLMQERATLQRRIEAIDGYLATFEASDEEPRKKAPAAKGKGFGIGSQPRKCKICAKPGHRSDTCPKRDGADEPDAIDPNIDEKLRCAACRDEGHLSKDCPELDAVIAEMKANGADSLKVASKLRLSLKQVNDHWPKGGREEDEEEI